MRIWVNKRNSKTKSNLEIKVYLQNINNKIKGIHYGQEC